MRINGRRVDSVAGAQHVLLGLYSVDLLVETAPGTAIAGQLVHWKVSDPDIDEADDSLTLRGATFVDGQDDRAGHVLLGTVNPNSWAGRSGRQPGERIREINGRPVGSAPDNGRGTHGGIGVDR